MSIVVRFSPTAMTSEKYNEATRRLEAAGVWPPDGLDYHVSFGSEGNLRVSKIWDSREQLDAFGERLMPILGDVGSGSTGTQRSSRSTTWSSGSKPRRRRPALEGWALAVPATLSHPSRPLASRPGRVAWQAPGRSDRRPCPFGRQPLGRAAAADLRAPNRRSATPSVTWRRGGDHSATAADTPSTALARTSPG